MNTIPSSARTRTSRLVALAAVVSLSLVGLGGVASGQEAPPSVLHLATNGQDPTGPICQSGQGTEANPFATFKVALRCLRPGGTLLVHEGTYTERVFFDISPEGRGRPDAPVVVTGAPGEDRPVVRGGIRIGFADYWTIQDLEIVGDGQSYRDRGMHPLKLVAGTGWVVQRVEVHDAPVTGLIRVEPAPEQLGGASPDDWAIRDSCIHGSAPSGGGLYEDHNLYVWTGDGGASGVIERNIIYDAPNGQNVKLGNRGGEQVGASDNVVVRFNTMSAGVQSIALVGDTDGAVIERNLLADIITPDGKEWYPAVRGLYLSGTGNRAHNNAYHGVEDDVLVYTDANSSYGGTIDAVGNVQVDPAFSDRTCEGFLPQDPAAQAYGVYGTGDVPSQVDPAQVERTAGANRVETAVALSGDVRDEARVAVLARADDYPDALASSALAGVLHAPVLLSGQDQVSESVMEELDRLGVDKVVLLGGSSALSARVDRQLRGAGYATDRIAGSNRYETAALAATEVLRLRAAGNEPLLPDSTLEVLLVEGGNADANRGWPDAVSAGQLAAAAGTPVLLTTSNKLPSATRAWLADNDPDLVTVVGGTAAVSREVLAQVDQLVGKVRRLSGASRYETARAVAVDVIERTSEVDPRTRTLVASGRTFADALTAAPAAAAQGGVLLLSAGTVQTNDLIYDFLQPVADQGMHVTVVGGTAAVPSTFEQGWPYE